MDVAGSGSSLDAASRGANKFLERQLVIQAECGAVNSLRPTGARRSASYHRSERKRYQPGHEWTSASDHGKARRLLGQTEPVRAQEVRSAATLPGSRPRERA